MATAAMTAAVAMVAAGAVEAEMVVGWPVRVTAEGLPQYVVPRSQAGRRP